MAGRGLVFVITGPSGVGKTTLLERLLAADARLRFSVSMTTRAPRPGEVDGEDYHFVTADAFERAVAAGELLEHAEVHGHRYGTPRFDLARRHAAGFDVLLDIDVQGARQVRALGVPAVFVFIAPPSFEVLEQRLRRRSTESERDTQRRLAAARDELAARGLFDYEVVNHDLATALDALRCIVTAERCRIRPTADEAESGPSAELEAVTKGATTDGSA